MQVMLDYAQKTIHVATCNWILHDNLLSTKRVSEYILPSNAQPNGDFREVRLIRMSPNGRWQGSCNGKPKRKVARHVGSRNYLNDENLKPKKPKTLSTGTKKLRKHQKSKVGSKVMGWCVCRQPRDTLFE